MREQGEEALREDPLQAILVEAGRRLNWIADYLTDKNILWKREKEFPIDQLTLTGTNTSWNDVILDRCHGSPQELRKLFQTDSVVKDIFASVKFADVAILVRFEEGKHFIFDGMNRVIAAIRDEKTTIDTFIATPKGKPKPQCEAHVVYDFLRSYQREINRDRAGLIAALQFLLNSYSNVEDLLRHRFSCFSHFFH